MENKEGFQEGIESFRKRLDDEVQMMFMNTSGFIDSRNSSYDVMHLIQNYRRSLEKCNLYISAMEVIIEKRIRNGKELADRINQLTEATTRDTSEQKELTDTSSQEGDGQISR